MIDSGRSVCPHTYLHADGWWPCDLAYLHDGLHEWEAAPATFRGGVMLVRWRSGDTGDHNRLVDPAATTGTVVAG